MEMEGFKGADIITAGFPCQDISYAGRGAGLSGKRSVLWWQVRRAVRMVRPRYALLENVAALLNRGLGTVLGGMASIRYDAEWHCIPASYVGSPQTRDRVWIVCHTDHYGQPASQKREGFIKGKDDNAKRPLPASKPKGPDNKPRKMEVTNHDSKRAQRHFPEKIQRQQAFSWFKGIGSLEDLRSMPNLPTPLFCGANNGIPDRAHRVKALGNAVVPQIPEIIGRVIIKKKP